VIINIIIIGFSPLLVILLRTALSRPTIYFAVGFYMSILVTLPVAVLAYSTLVDRKSVISDSSHLIVFYLSVFLIVLAAFA